MDFKVVFKDSFLADLERIVRLIAIDNPVAAQKLGEAVIWNAESLAFFPERYPRVNARISEGLSWRNISKSSTGSRMKPGR